MIFHFFIFLALVFYNSALSMHHALIVFGPSCSGKSTLSRKLCRRFDAGWCHIDRDDLVDSGIIGEHDLAGFAAFINKRLETHSIVVDTNAYSQEFFEAIKAKQKIRILVYNPLEQLLARDASRTLHLKRSEQKAKRAREFVLAGYSTFFGGQKNFATPFTEKSAQVCTPFAYDVCVSGSEQNIDTIVSQIRTLINSRK